MKSEPATKPTLAQDLEEALCNILLGEKIPLDVMSYVRNAPNGHFETLIPAGKRINRTDIRRMVAHYETIEIDPSPVRNKVREYIAREVAKHPPSLREVTEALRYLMEEVDEYKGHGNPGFPDRAGAYLAIQRAKDVLKRAGIEYRMKDTYKV